MPHYEYCDSKQCKNHVSGYMSKGVCMLRIYTRSSEGKAIRDYKIGLGSVGSPKAQIRKQIWKPIGWLCPYCKKLRYDKGFWKEPDTN